MLKCTHAHCLPGVGVAGVKTLNAGGNSYSSLQPLAFPILFSDLSSAVAAELGLLSVQRTSLALWVRKQASPRVQTVCEA